MSGTPKKQTLTKIPKTPPPRKKSENPASLFADPYFKGLKPEQVIELAKKSIRLSKDNCELRDQVEALERQVEDLREDLTMAVCEK